MDINESLVVVQTDRNPSFCSRTRWESIQRNVVTFKQTDKINSF